MNQTLLDKKVQEFSERLPGIRQEIAEHEPQRQAFYERFPIGSLQTMPIEDYVLNSENHNQDNFSYWMEYRLSWFGNFTGAPADKRFGIYYGHTRSDPENKYRFVRRYGATYQDAYQDIRNLIVQLLADGSKGDRIALVRNGLSPMFKGKILATYYPHMYLDIYSESHLDHFLNLLLADPEMLRLDPIDKRDALIAFKNSNPTMAGWTNMEFNRFLYFLGHPDHPTPTTEPFTENDLEVPVFPPDPIPEIIEIDLPSQTVNESLGGTPKKGGYGYQYNQRRNKVLGDRGEEIVLKLERERLSSLPSLVNKVEQVSKKDDRLGFDILSWEEDGTERYIEVKATTAPSGSLNFFLTYNELEKAQSLKNYYIYVVFEVNTMHPKVWRWRNPFDNEKHKELLTPILYRFHL